jgi:hypothetical protein
MAFLVWLLSYTSRKPCFEVIKCSKLTTIVNEENSKRIIFYKMLWSATGASKSMDQKSNIYTGAALAPKK